jgi:cell division protein FtsW
MGSRRSTKYDFLLLGIVFILLILGIIMVYSASSVRALETYNDSIHFLIRHSFRVGLGIIALFVCARIDYHQWRSVTPLMLICGLGFLIVVLFMPEINGSKRAIPLGGIQFQPSEFMKLILILYFSAIFAQGKLSPSHQHNNLRIHYGLFMIIVALVFIEPDLGTSMVLFFIGLFMFYLAGVSKRRLAGMVIFTVPLITVSLALFPYQRKRLFDFVGSVFGSEPMNYHVKQSIIGLAHGGFRGVGYGVGKQKLYFLPEPYSDFILSSLGEEIGFLGISLVLVLMCLILWRGIRIALRAPDRYGYLVGSGITLMILINALINAGVIVNLLPTTGLPFPFLSYGGSSLLVHLTGVGILLNISRHSIDSYRDFTYKRGRMYTMENEGY